MIKINKYNIPEYELLVDRYRPILNVKREIEVSLKEIQETKDVVNIMKDAIGIHKYYTEHLYILLMNDQNIITGISEMAIGGKGEVSVPIKEMIITLLLSGATRFYMIHNHPDAPAILSTDDNDLVNTVRFAIKIIDIELIDSIVISSDGEWSSYEVENDFELEESENDIYNITFKEDDPSIDR